MSEFIESWADGVDVCAPVYVSRYVCYEHMDVKIHRDSSVSVNIGIVSVCNCMHIGISL